MYQLEPWVLFIRSLVTAFIIGCVGLVLVNIRLNIKKLITIAASYALFVLVIRMQVLPPLIMALILPAILVILIKLAGKTTFPQAFISTVLGMLVLGLLEVLVTPIVYKIFALEMADLLQNNYVLLLIPLPQIILSLAIVGVCLKYNYYLFDFPHWDLLYASLPNEKRVKTIMILASSMLFLLLLQLIFNMNIFSLLPRRVLLDLTPNNVDIIINTSMVAAFFMMIILIQQLSVLLKKESEYMLQSAYIHTQDEIYTATRAEAHDRINHIQTLYGFVQMGNLAETRLYLEEMMGEIIVSPQFIETGNPGLSSLFYIKSGLATAHGIQLDIKMNIRVDHISVPAFELNRILGNLINNSFDSILGLDKAYRKVEIVVDENGPYYLFLVSNHGQIVPEHKAKLFTRGYSTKTGQHQGLGLYIVKKLVDKNDGRIEVNNQDNNVVATVYLPKLHDQLDVNYSGHERVFDA